MSSIALLVKDNADLSHCPTIANGCPGPPACETMGCVGAKPANVGDVGSSRSSNLGFSANYKLGKTLGQGTYSVVKEAVHKVTGTTVFPLKRPQRE